MRRAALVLAVLVSGAPAASAQLFDSPKALLGAFYAPYLGGAFPADETPFRSQALNALYAADAENTPPGEQGALSADPYIDGQDYELSGFGMGEPRIKGDKALVEVSFDNFDRPTRITYQLVFEDGSWRIGDLFTTGENGYRLTEIFEDARQDW